MRRSLMWLGQVLRRNRFAKFGSLLLGVVLTISLFGPLVVPYEPGQSFEGWLPMGRAHWLGTDSQGYDILTRIVFGGRTTIRIALLATIFSITLGTIIGAICGYFGGTLDLVLMRIVDFVMSFPSFLLAMIAVAVLGKDLNNLIYAVGTVGAPVYARQMRAEAVRIAATDYVTAAQALGASPARIVLRHVVPNSAGSLIVLATLGIGSVMLDVAGLNFLGLGGDPYKISEWGLLLNQGWREVGRGTIQVVAAGTAIFVTVLGFNLVGDGLRQELDPYGDGRFGL